MYDGPQFGPLNIERNFRTSSKNPITQGVTGFEFGGPTQT